MNRIEFDESRLDQNVSQSHPPESHDPIYIGGLDRTGKTILAAFLSSHPNIAITPAGLNLWTYFYKRHGTLERPANSLKAVDEILRYQRVRLLEVDADRVRAEFMAGPRTYGRLFALPAREYARRHGKQRWGAQSGLIEEFAGEIFDESPGACIVHMVRDPRDRFEAARQRAAPGRGGVGPATARWLHSIRLAGRNLARFPGRYLVVRFEDLVLETRRTLQEICEFLGEAFLEDMLTMDGAPERRQRLRQEAGESAPHLLAPEFVGRFSALPPEDIAFMQRYAGGQMRRFGYDLDPQRLPSYSRWLFRTVLPQRVRMGMWNARQGLQHAFPRYMGPKVDPDLMAPARPDQEPR